jgi:hypothetical protein
MKRFDTENDTKNNNNNNHNHNGHGGGNDGGSGGGNVSEFYSCNIYTVKSHILGNCPIFSKSGYGGMSQLIGTLFFPLLRACHFIRKRDS